MSYDLSFCVRESQPLPGVDALAAALVATPGIKLDLDEAGQRVAVYENDATGVYALFDLLTGSASTAEERAAPAGVTEAPVAFRLNYIRPTFFALECMPVVERFAADQGLLVVNPQEATTHADLVAEPASATALIESYERHNDQAVRALFGHQPSLRDQLGYLPRPDADEWWEYARAKPALDARLEEEDTFVPESFLLRRPRERRLLRAAAWGEGIRSVIPPGEGLMMARTVPGRGLLKRRTDVDTRWVPRVHAVDRLGDAVLPVDGAPDGTLVMRVGSEREVADAFSDLFEAASRIGRGDLEGVPTDRFVDVDA